MSMIQGFINELTHESANTRKMLERIPGEAFSFKPHDKSMGFGRLATHVAELPGWVAMTVKTDELDFDANKYTPFIAASTEDLLAHHDENVAKALEALQGMPAEDLMKPWTLRRGEQILMSMPKVAIIRNMCLNHLIHHRGQLSVYMRLNGIELPGIYGPTADEMEMAAKETAATA